MVEKSEKNGGETLRLVERNQRVRESENDLKQICNDRNTLGMVD